MKKLNLIALTSAACLTLFAFAATQTGCKKKDDTPVIKGTPGDPRFNLVFDNEQNVDLDLHVLTPNGREIYYSNKNADGGSLDVDCLCSNCPNGPNENIYWVPGTAPHGTYKFWVEYYDDCGVAGAASNFTLRRVVNSEVKETYTGTLSSQGKSAIYTYTY